MVSEMGTRLEACEKSANWPLSAVLLHDQEEPMALLAPVLAELDVSTVRVRTCAQAGLTLARCTTPQLLFSETILPDGTWADAVKIAARAPVPVNVIIVARFVNIRFYVEVIERGAFDFVTPPFVISDLSHVVRCAQANLNDRRLARARSA